MQSHLILPAVFFLAASSVPAASIWINELHYDNAGGDVNEFVEIIVDTSVIDITDVSLSFYNGNGGSTYATANTFALGDTLDGSFAVYTVLQSGIQNGAPDGISLNVSGAVVSFISYEGVLTAMDGPAMGLTSTDIGIAETSSTTASSSLGLAGSGMMGAADGGDFIWTTFADTATLGSLNGGQVLVVPEPSSAMFLSAAALALIARRRRSEQALF